MCKICSRSGFRIALFLLFAQYLCAKHTHNFANLQHINGAVAIYIKKLIISVESSERYKHVAMFREFAKLPSVIEWSKDNRARLEVF